MTTLQPSLVENSPRWSILATLRKFQWQPILWGVAGVAILLSRLYLMITRSIQFTDESLYLAETQAMFHQGVMVPWAWNPGVAVLNMIWYAPFYNIALGLDYASRVATFFCSMATFGLMLLNLKGLVRKSYWLLLAVVLSLAAVPFWNTILNSSDNYYLVFALLVMLSLRYALHHSPTHWSWIIVAWLLAVSTTLRNDGTVVYALTTIVYGWILWRVPLAWSQRVFTFLRTWILPIGVILALYWGVGLRGGGFYDVFTDTLLPRPVSVSERTYLAFEQGEARIKRFEFRASGQNPFVEGMISVRALYGTPEENGSNVFRAIARNPTEWVKRVGLNFRDFYLTWHEAFQNHGTLIFIASMWGLVLLAQYRPKDALIFLLIIAPISVYFLFTFWQVRYITMLAPLLVVLSIYTLSIFMQTPHPSERKWSVMAAVLSGLSVGLTYYFGDLYGNPLPIDTLILTILFYGLLVWRFIWQRGLSMQVGRWMGAMATILLILGTFRPPPYAEYILNSYSNEISDYISFAYRHYPDARVCLGDSDLEASSLVWYTRQTPVPIANNIRTELINGTLDQTMQANNCSVALLAYAGWDNPALIGTSEAFANTNAQILFQSDAGAVVLLKVLPSP
jgi:hypothetical protein